MRRDDICIYVSPANRARLESIMADRNSKSKTVWCARSATAEGHGTNAIMKRTGKSKPCGRRWQERYIEARAPAWVASFGRARPMPLRISPSTKTLR